MTVEFEPLIAPLLDSRSERQLVESAAARVYEVSEGAINDLGPSSPITALIEGQCFAQAEFLYFLNQLPEAFLIYWLQLFGIQRRLGSYAQTTVEFQLSEARPIPFTIPQGYVVVSNGGVTFTCNEELIIQAGDTVGRVGVTCTELGLVGNVPVGAIARVLQPLTGLSLLWNPDPGAGGTEEESISEVKLRAFQAIRRRGLISADDYENEAQEYLGEGAPALAIGSRGQDPRTIQEGSVHVFARNLDGSALNGFQIQELGDRLLQKSLLGIRVWVSNIDVHEIDVEVIAQLAKGTSPESTASSIYSNLNRYLRPQDWGESQTIVLKEIEYQARLAGVEFIQSVALRERSPGVESETVSPPLPTNIRLPYPWSAPTLGEVTIILVTEEDSYRYTF